MDQTLRDGLLWGIFHRFHEFQHLEVLSRIERNYSSGVRTACGTDLLCKHHKLGLDLALIRNRECRLNRCHSIIFARCTPGLRVPCMPRSVASRRAGSEASGPLMPGPPLPWMRLVTLFAQSLARALMVHSGKPHFSDAQARVLGVLSSLPRT